MKPMQAKLTPNPNALKFQLERVRWSDQHSFRTVAAAAAEPLAAALFALPGVTNVFWTRDFVTVNKQPEATWDALQPQIEQVLHQFLDAA